MGKIRRRRKTIRKYCRLSRSSSSSTISFPPQFGWLATAKEVIVLYSVAARGANKRWDVKLTRKNLTAIFNAAPPPKREKMISYFSIKWRGAPSSHHPAKRFNNHTRTGQERNAFKAAPPVALSEFAVGGMTVIIINEFDDYREPASNSQVERRKKGASIDAVVVLLLQLA